MNLLKAASKLTAASTLSQVVSFVGITVFARLLGPEKLGVYFLFQSVLVFARIPVDFGLSGAVEKRLSEGNDESEILASFLLMKTVLVVGAVGCVLLGANYIESYVGASLTFAVVAGIVLRTSYLAAVRVLAGELRVGETAMVRLSRTVVWVVSSYGLIVTTSLGIRSVVYGHLVGSALALAVGWYRVSTSIGRPSLEHGKQLWSYAKYNALSTISSIGYNWIDVSLLGVFFGPAAVGAYEVAWRVTDALLLVSRSFADSIVPQVSNWHANDDHQSIQEFIPSSMIVVLLVPLPGFAGAVLLSEEILGTVFGPAFVTAATAMVVLAAGRCVEAFSMANGRVVHGLDRPDIGAKVSIVSVLLNVTVNLVLIPRMGVFGAAIGTVAGFTVGASLMLYYLTRFVEVSVPLTDLGYLTVASLAMSLVVLVMNAFIGSDSIFTLIVVIGAGGIGYLAFLIAIRPFRRSLHSIVRQLS